MRENSLYEAIESMNSNDFIRNEPGQKFVKSFDPTTEMESMLEETVTTGRFHDNYLNEEQNDQNQWVPKYPNDTFEAVNDMKNVGGDFHTITVEAQLIFDLNSNSTKIIFSGIGNLKFSKDEMQRMKDDFTKNLLKKQQEFRLQNREKEEFEVPSKIQMQIRVPMANEY